MNTYFWFIYLITINLIDAQTKDSAFKVDLHSGLITLDGRIPSSEKSDSYYLASINDSIEVVFRKNFSEEQVKNDLNIILMGLKSGKFKHKSYLILMSKIKNKKERLFFEINTNTNEVIINYEFKDGSQINFGIPKKLFVSSILK